MSPRASFWLIILVLAAGTWAMRSIPIMLHGHVPNPPWLERLLKHVPVAALTALVVPGALYLKTDGILAFAPARAVAATVALFVALRTKNVLATLFVGMAVLWLGQWGLAAL
ncbi:MAG: branched-chain amino acid ABC transporter permease [Coriobacteriaceae bacterium]|nr:branched-chain amino acid ABC transporter permease [Coriobacteriaceae bacterium]